jgi:hypothetical protein
MWQVIEHLPNPWACLKKAAANLEVGGVLVVATPNPGSLGFRLLRGHWPHVDAPRHLWLIPADLLERKAAEHGLVLETLTARDLGARRWNRFAWERVLMNAAPRSERLQRVGFAAGVGLSIMAALPERIGFSGSCYTAVFRKFR